MGCEPRPLSSIGPRRGATSRARAGCKFVLSTLLATIAFFTASTVSTHAQTNWTGAVSNGWFNAGNWNADVPTAATSANIDTVTPHSTEVRGAGARALNLTVGQNGIGMLAIPNGGTLTDFGGFVGNYVEPAPDTVTVPCEVSMSLDNVLAVAGAAREHPIVLAFGLVLSITLMGVAAKWVARLLQKQHSFHDGFRLPPAREE
jgi:hypothetical protein